MGTSPGQGFGAAVHRGTEGRVVLRLVAEAAQLLVVVRIGKESLCWKNTKFPFVSTPTGKL